MHLHTYHYFQLLSLFVAAYCYKGLKSFSITAFIPLLLFTCVIEITASNSVYFGWKSNYFIYNIYSLLSTPIFMYLLYNMLRLTAKAKYIFVAVSILVQIFILLDYFFLKEKNALNIYSLLITQIIYIVFSCIILIQQATDEKNNSPLDSRPFFWINAVLLLFSLAVTVVMGLQQYILKYQIRIEGKTLTRIIMPFDATDRFLLYWIWHNTNAYAYTE